MYFPWFNRKTNWCHVPNAFQKGTEAQEPTWIDHVPALQAEEPQAQEHAAKPPGAPTGQPRRVRTGF